MEVNEAMKELEVKEVSEVIATLEVIDDTLAGDVSSRTNVVNSVNFNNFDNFNNIKVMANSKSFREVRAWQKAHEFVLAFYKTKPMFPDDEKFALIPQFQRAAVSIAANIAEGYRKLSKADKLRFFNIAQGSLEECRYYIILSHDVGYYTDATANDMWTKIESASTVLNAYCKAIKDNKGITDEE
jgi:four helix bundle protein